MPCCLARPAKPLEHDPTSVNVSRSCKRQLGAQTIGLPAAAVVLIGAFVFVEDRVAAPLRDLDLVRKNHAFAAGIFAALLNYAGVFAITILTSVYLQVVEGYTPQQAGLLLLVQPVLMAGLSPLFGWLSDRVGSRVLASGGMVLCALGILQLGIMPRAFIPSAWSWSWANSITLMGARRATATVRVCSYGVLWAVFCVTMGPADKRNPVWSDQVSLIRECPGTPVPLGAGSPGRR
jgi:nitrate/nitrite transporter NarK